MHVERWLGQPYIYIYIHIHSTLATNRLPRLINTFPSWSCRKLICTAVQKLKKHRLKIIAYIYVLWQMPLPKATYIRLIYTTEQLRIKGLVLKGLTVVMPGCELLTCWSFLYHCSQRMDGFIFFLCQVKYRVNWRPNTHSGAQRPESNIIARHCCRRCVFHPGRASQWAMRKVVLINMSFHAVSFKFQHQRFQHSYVCLKGATGAHFRNWYVLKKRLIESYQNVSMWWSEHNYRRTKQR